MFGLDFPGTAQSTMRFRFTRPLPMYPATYVWRYRPRQKAGYFTTFFWGNDGSFYWDGGSVNSYYGAHPYPYADGPQRWSIAVNGGDPTGALVAFDRWYLQALRVWSDSSGKRHQFLWNLPNTDDLISTVEPSSYGTKAPPRPALTWGDAPWAPGEEVCNGVLRGIQVYAGLLSVDDILREAQSPMSTATGATSIWYLNSNPTPSDITDKKNRGQANDPEWVGAERPRLWIG